MTKITSFAECSAGFNQFFIDQFGVLHDGYRAYPGAVAALEKLKTRGAKIVILSNSGRSGAINTKRLENLGFAPSLYDHFVTSGDVAARSLRNNDLPVKIDQETRCFTISSNCTADLADELGLRITNNISDAELVVISGSQAGRISLLDYEQLLEPAARRNTPCLCTNPDKLMLTSDGIMPGSGAIAEIYENLGGIVYWVGKPYSRIYAAAAALVGSPKASEILCIGDSVEHDIVGARRFGAACALVRTGILADLSEAELQREFEKYGATPDFIIASLK